MAVKAVTKYQSSDGQLHDDVQTARKHDATKRNMDTIKGITQNINPGLLHIDLANKPHVAKQLRDALNKVLETHRHYGKLKAK